MPFEFERQKIKDVILVKPKVFGDNRGFFMEAYKKSEFAENGIDFERSRLFVWPENPTAEYMSKYWHDCLTELINKELLNNNTCSIDSLTVEVEETTHNSVTYTD